MRTVRVKDLQFHELEAFLKQLGWEKYRAKQVFNWIYAHKVNSYEAMTNLPKTLREALWDNSELFTLTIDANQIFFSQQDGTIKFVSYLADNIGIETTVMKYNYGNTVCISTQAGCNMHCAFCASAHGGKKRDLTPGEMIDQVILAEQLLSENESIDNIVIMGIGEPLENYDHTMQFVDLVNDANGLNVGMRKITISTCGLVPGIYRLAEEKPQLNLAISLHAPTNSLRTKLVPLNRKYPLGELLLACQAHFRKTHRKVTFEYVLLAGVNDGQANAQKLIKLLEKYDFIYHINVIPFNPVEESLFEAPDPEKVNEFLRLLQSHGLSVTLRQRKGADIEGACGQLRTKVEG